jgi:hypothetical protein
VGTFHSVRVPERHLVEAIEQDDEVRAVAQLEQQAGEDRGLGRLVSAAALAVDPDRAPREVRVVVEGVLDGIAAVLGHAGGYRPAQHQDVERLSCLLAGEVRGITGVVTQRGPVFDPQVGRRQILQPFSQVCRRPVLGAQLCQPALVHPLQHAALDFARAPAGVDAVLRPQEDARADLRCRQREHESRAHGKGPAHGPPQGISRGHGRIVNLAGTRGSV